MLFAAAAAFGLTAHAAAAAGDGPSGKLRGFVMSPAPEVGSFSLPDATQGGAPLALTAAPGGLMLVYFGYTACPDICPTTLSDLGVALRRLGKPAERVDVAMVTVDPERDTADVLDGYVGHFITRGHHALRTDDPSELARVANAFGARYEVRKEADGAVEVGHSALVYAVDDRGIVQVAWPFGMSSRAVTKDPRVLLRDQNAP